MSSEKTLPWWKRFLRNTGTTFYHFCLEWSGDSITTPEKAGKSKEPEKPLHEKDALGLRGEEEAVKFLKKNGYAIKARNVKFKIGELDIVAQKGNCVVFVEVKTRKTAESGQPYEAVNSAKQRRIVSLAEVYIQKFYARRIDLVYRFDIISIVWPEGGEPKIEHIENAFDASEKYHSNSSRARSAAQ